MSTWVQLPLFTPPRAMPHLRLLQGGPITPEHLWALLTPAQQQTAQQILLQISLEIVEAAEPEAHHEHP
jgi:hypothetical protein